MDLTPKSYLTASPQYSSGFRPHPTLNNSIYPTPPQSRGQSDELSAHSPAISGLGIINCGLPSSSAQLPIGSSSQSLVPLTQCWPSEPTSSGCFSNASLTYPPLSIYDDIDTLPTTATSPFPVSSSHSEAPNHLAFFNSQRHARSSNMDLQRASVFDHYDLSERANIIPRTQQRVTTQFTPPFTRSTHKRSFQDGQLSYQTPVTSVPSNFHRGPGGILLDLDTNFSNQTMQSRNQPSLLRSSNVSAPSGVSNSTTNYKEGVRKPARKQTTTTTAKYQCDKCGMSFTRSSNCKSHMKIHDPNRKYPHKCTYGNCTKKFSRKTDLDRHVDSVHKRLKNFACDQCGHKFARQDTLRRHCEDGCRRQRRLSQRPGAMASVSLNNLQSYQQPPVLYRETGPTYRTTDATSHSQLQSPFSRPLFTDHGPLPYSQFTC